MAPLFRCDRCGDIDTGARWNTANGRRAGESDARNSSLPWLVHTRLESYRRPWPVSFPPHPDAVAYRDGYIAAAEAVLNGGALSAIRVLLNQQQGREAEAPYAQGDELMQVAAFDRADDGSTTEELLAEVRTNFSGDNAASATYPAAIDRVDYGGRGLSIGDVIIVDGLGYAVLGDGFSRLGAMIDLPAEIYDMLSNARREESDG
ncbi:hypothetical protein ACIGO9_31790 [Nocardia asteroides]|uniref:hypothetical protein n=1 Tax=Nocardia asteroides TaxID=1824 RepID=UPI0037C6EC6C